MVRAISNVAILHNRIETCLKAATAPMTKRELQSWPSISEAAGGTNLKATQRIDYHITQMCKKRLLEKIGGGYNTTYKWCGEAEEVSIGTNKLNLVVNKKSKSIQISFEGLEITISVK